MGVWWVLVGCGPRQMATPTEPVTLHIAALNDWHGALYEQPVYNHPERAWGGLGWLVGTMDVLRGEHPDLIVLDGGDVFQGAWAVNATAGAGAVAAYNLLGVDAVAVGNHEFDYGGTALHPTRGALMEAAAAADFSWLAANITRADGKPWMTDGISRHTVIERGGIKLGVIGLATTETPETTLSRNVADLTFTDPVAAVRDVLPDLKAAGVHAIAVVGHLTGSCATPGYLIPPSDDCRPEGEIGRLLDELPPGTIDIIVAGHAHTLLNQRIDDTFVIESRDRGKLIGQLDLVITPDGVDADASRLLPHVQVLHDAVDPGCGEGTYDRSPQQVSGRMVSPSAAALDLVARLEAEAGSLCDDLGCARAPMGRDYSAESAAGDFVADAMLEAFEGADLAIQNPGGLRADLPAGTLRREHIHQLMPFDNALYLLEMDGAQLTRLFEIGTSGAHGVLQVSIGTRYRFDPDATTERDLDGDGEAAEWEVDRLCELSIAGAPVDPTARYRVVTTDFLYNGGDHLGPGFADAVLLERGPLLRDALYEAATSPADVCLDVARPGSRISAGSCQ
ncbi:MAG: 5'-nucleotidase [Myxococcota bacterium]|jgi:5'-nucleotidase